MHLNFGVYRLEIAMFSFHVSQISNYMSAYAKRSEMNENFTWAKNE